MIYEFERGDTIATLMPRYDTDANAALMAAAPDLLAVAEMVALLGPGDPAVETLKQQTRDAIQKARGHA
jgi:hypothetical protein